MFPLWDTMPIVTATHATAAASRAIRDRFVSAPGHAAQISTDVTRKTHLEHFTRRCRSASRRRFDAHFFRNWSSRGRHIDQLLDGGQMLRDHFLHDDRALEILKAAPPDVMNHNLETIPRLYREARPGSDYQFSLNLLKKFKALHPDVPTKSGIMVGLGETDEEVLQVMQDMRDHDIEMLTIGQYLAPSTSHLTVKRYVHPDTFKMFETEAYKMGFKHAAVGAMVRSSYHADAQAGHAMGTTAG